MVFYPNPNALSLANEFGNEEIRVIHPQNPPIGIDEKFIKVINTEKRSAYSRNTNADNSKVTKTDNNKQTQETSKIFNDFAEAMKFSKLNTPSQLKRIGDSWLVELK